MAGIGIWRSGAAGGIMRSGGIAWRGSGLRAGRVCILLGVLWVELAGMVPSGERTRELLGEADLRTRIELNVLAEHVEVNEREAADAERIKERLREQYRRGARSEAERVVGWLADQLADGSWAEFDYRTVARQFFPPFEHLRRLNAMALSFLDTADGDERLQLLDGIRRGIEIWIALNPQTRHNWFLEIGVPLQLTRLLVLMEPHLDAALLDKAFPLMTVAIAADDYYYNGAPATGANLTWIARSALEAALLTGRYALAQQAARRLGEEIRLALDEGIQPDAGFYQHGRQFYAGGYGASFIHDCAVLIGLLDGTGLAIETQRVQLLVDFILEGVRWMTRHGQWVAGSRGREISRPGGRMGAAAVENLLRADAIPRRAELRQFAAALQVPRGELPQAVTGNRQFWSVDLMAHHRANWSAFINLTSKRIFGTEGGNQENLLGYHLVDGVVEIMRSGTEYHNIAPLWDWKKLPGTTLRQYSGPPPHIDWWGDGTRGTTDFVGGVSDGTTGMAVLEFDRHGVRADKAWALFDAVMVTTGINVRQYGGTSDPLITTLEQRYRNGAVSIELADGHSWLAAEGETRIDGPAWIRHDGMAWHIPQGNTAVLQLEQRSAPWSLVNQSGNGNPRVESAALFTLWLEHDATQSSTFSAMLLPDLASDSPLPASNLLPQVNTDGSHYISIQDPVSGIIQAVAFKAVDQGLPAGRFSASIPIALQLRPLAIGSELTIADPSGLNRVLELSLPAGWTGASADHKLRVLLPAGDHAGNSIRINMAGLRELTPLNTSQQSVIDSIHASMVPLAAHGYAIASQQLSLRQWQSVRLWALANGYTIAAEGQHRPADAQLPPEQQALVRVNWFNAVLWCNALSEMAGLEPVYYADVHHREVLRTEHLHLTPAHVRWQADGYRLPSEAEWELACRAMALQVADFLDPVSEWCFDFYAAPQRIDPAYRGPLSGYARVRRGGIKGGFPGGEQSCALRLLDAPVAGSGNTGIRLSRSLEF